MRAKVILITGVLTGLLVSTGGCNSARPHVISAVPKDASATYFVSEQAGLAEGALLHGASIYWNGPTGSNANEQQIELVDRAIQNRSFGIVVTPISPFAMDTVIARALAHNIPVVILGAPIPLPPDRNLSFVLNDIERTGALAAERIHHLVGSAGEVVLAGIDPNSPGSTSCAVAFESSLHRIAPGIRIVSHLTGSYTPGQVETAMEQVINEHPHLSAVYSLDVAVTQETVAALRDSGRAGSVAIVGNDQSLDLLFLVRQHVIDSLLIEDMRDMGRQAVENIVAIRSGRAIASTSVREPLLLTGDNIDTEAIQQRLRMDWRPLRATAKN